MRRTPLHDGWTVRAAESEVVPATVPGCVHTDLLAAGRIPDPYLDQNEAELAWIGQTDWRYEMTFDWQPDGDDRVDLVCDGLDTIATVQLNGVVVGQTYNMHRGYRFDVGENLRPGGNQLVVTFASPIGYAVQQREKLGARPGAYAYPYNFIRKMACNFGWDWGPALVTAGIWRPIALESWSTARLASVRPIVAVEGKVGKVAVQVEVERAGDGELPLTVRVGDIATEAVVPAGEDSVTVEVEVPEPRLWWPRGYGEQPLYPLRVELAGDTYEREIGFRTVRLDTGRDDIGTRFTFVVNDVPVFARGVNWIPDDCFPHRVDRDRYARRLDQTVEAGANLVRVWGGGIYESDDFYALCDERGLLVWQDFLFACAAYPEEEPLRGEVVAEARQAVTRLVSHPSLVLWNGNNENIWGYHDWNWRDQLDDRSWGLGYYLDVLPKIVAELDPSRPYNAGSPWSLSEDIHPNDPNHGCMHVWDVWNVRDYSGYRDYVPRFAAEFGFQGPPAWSTLTRAVHDEPLAVRGPAMLAHQKAVDGMEKIDRSLVEHFRVPEDFGDWFWAAQLNQARAVSSGVQWFRSWTPRCAGTILWQINDCWPVTSWSVVDGDGRLKPAWYALRRSYADRFVTIQPRDDGLAVIVVNDTDDDWDDAVTVHRISFDGNVIASVELDLALSARGSLTTMLPESVAVAGDRTRELLVATSAAGRAVWFFAPDKDLALPASAYDLDCVAISGGCQVTVTAHVLLLDVALLADQVAADAVVDDMLVTLLPGESVTFTVRTDATVDPDDFGAVIRTANQLVQ
ncbi:glycoside hydrolase family 2 protein [Fodinicola acaciae]|uniref:glycoside hydrolase family 2 protein n=1 Tax=Fodinicola acaciae TaxID=2681555 RepID=UPI001651EF5B|nr:glycoside hydrolase family 2 protein [Fodinicola acaciae]